MTGALKAYEIMLNYSMPKLPDIKMPPGIKWPAHIENHLKLIKTIKSPIHDYMTVETALSKQIREMNQVLFKPNETMASLMARQTQLVTSISAAESAWQKLHKPVIFDGTFTIPTYIAHFQRTSALTLWSQQYGAMYMRIAEELRRQRIELSTCLTR